MLSEQINLHASIKEYSPDIPYSQVISFCFSINFFEAMACTMMMTMTLEYVVVIADNFFIYDSIDDSL